MKNILTEALVNSATNASFIFSYTNSAKLRIYINSCCILCIWNDVYQDEQKIYKTHYGL